MHLDILKKRLKDLIQERNEYLVFGLCSIIVNMLLAFILIVHHSDHRTIIVPPQLKQSFWVDDHGVSASYLAEMTRYLANLELNMTPESADYQIEEILEYTDPATYGVLKEELIQHADALKKESLTVAFFPVNVSDLDTQHLQATITGDLFYFVGKQQTTTDRVSYTASYRYSEGRLFLKSFEEVEKNA